MITLHSDDFGYKNYSDKKIIQLLKEGRIKSVSVLVNMAQNRSLNALVRICRVKPEIKVGLHLNLIEGKSLNHQAYIPSIVYGRGNFYPLKSLVPRLFLHLANPDHIEREIRSQINALKVKGFIVSFIDSHQHLHAISPIAELVKKVASDEKIKLIRSYKKVKTYTLIAKIKHLVLKSAAFASYLFGYGKLNLPTSWNVDNGESYSFMSWEGHNFDISKVRDKKMIFVAHPFLQFDTNVSYLNLII